MAGEPTTPTDQEGRPRTDVTRALMEGGGYGGSDTNELSPGEARFERIRHTVGWILTPVVVVGFALLPLGMDPRQQLLAAVLLGVVVMWVCEPIPIPVAGLLGVCAVVLLGVAPAGDVLAPFGSTTVFTFIGAFILAQAMLRHGLARRLAFFVLSLPGVGKSTLRIIIAFGLVTAMLSALISNTATVAMLLPTALGILGVIAKLMQDRGAVRPDFDPKRLRVGAALMLMLTYGAGMGGLVTPVGTPPNLIGRGLIEEATGERISIVQWFLTALPIALIMLVAVVVVLFLVNPPEIRRIEGVEEHIREQRALLGPMARAEVNTLVAFAVTVSLWLAPAVVGLVSGTDSTVYAAVDDTLDEGIVAVLGACLLFLLPVGRGRATMRWKDAQAIDWGTILLFGTGMIFGSLLTGTGLAATIGNGAHGLFGIGTQFALVAFSALLAMTISETTSNTATAAVVVPIVIPLAVAAGVDPVVPAMAATLGASFGFMLPVSTPQNAIVYGSGTVPLLTMIKTGIGLNIVGTVTLIGLIVPLTALTGISG
ncbi:DASS family sodium-coupled anion symporter [Nocardiopsis sp. MG754419]|uniref:SLC13 family permease n=1 Tax=Nocardiopsis sp. MG754419 TaxID=2259865 RepID=UPI0020113BEF|nr:DASS family sodium-coupled anion symporter [Nocardiopsis sp. MG754419]MBR8742081.1 anion transporter [Nocardiopsis sp. MG754419]